MRKNARPVDWEVVGTLPLFGNCCADPKRKSLPWESNFLPFKPDAATTWGPNTSRRLLPVFYLRFTFFSRRGSGRSWKLIRTNGDSAKTSISLAEPCTHNEGNSVF